MAVKETMERSFHFVWPIVNILDLDNWMALASWLDCCRNMVTLFWKLTSTLNFDIIIIPGIFGKLAFIGIFGFITSKLRKMAIDSNSFLMANPFEISKKEE